MSEQIWWYTARAGGIVGWVLLAASVLWGLAISTKATAGKVRPNWMLDLHRFLGGLAVIFVGVHVFGIVADSYVHFGPADVLVPFASGYQPSAVAWGIVALYFLVAVEATSLARKHLPRKVWRMTHMLAFPLFACSTIHGLTAGTDATQTWLQAVMIAASVAVGVLTAVRLAGSGGRSDRGERAHQLALRADLRSGHRAVGGDGGQRLVDVHAEGDEHAHRQRPGTADAGGAVDDHPLAGAQPLDDDRHQLVGGVQRGGVQVVDRVPHRVGRRAAQPGQVVGEPLIELAGLREADDRRRPDLGQGGLVVGPDGMLAAQPQPAVDAGHRHLVDPAVAGAGARPR
jgi:methionine sulfoxide reductase heme-binding subunit